MHLQDLQEMNSESHNQLWNPVQTSRQPHLLRYDRTAASHLQKTVQSGTQTRLSFLAWLSCCEQDPCRPQHGTFQNMVTISWVATFFDREVFVFIFFSYKITNSWQINPPIPSLPSHPLQFLLQDLFLFYKSKLTEKTREKSTVKAVKIDTYYQNILKHIRKCLYFSFRERGVFWLRCHTWSDLLSLNDVC